MKNLQSIADERGWSLKRVFSEEVSGTTKSDSRKEFKAMVSFIVSMILKWILKSKM